MDSEAATFYRCVIKEEDKRRHEGVAAQLPPAETVKQTDRLLY